jgi:3-dehydroquinate synthase
MATVRIDFGDRGYEITIEPGALSLAAEKITRELSPSRVAVIADANVSRLYGEKLAADLRATGSEAFLLPFPAGENSKRLEQLSLLYDQLFEHGLDRKSVIVALGGGVTGDLAGFVAATFMRGVRFVQIPTSLLAQVDSSSGGKTGVNHPLGKNLIGSFHQPSMVIADPETLRTLPKEELLSGLAEVVKHGVIRDEKYFALIEEKAENILALDMEALTQVVDGSCRIKGAVVAQDEREGGVRALLNFGHTFGHAYETLSGFAIRHGEAVAIGMIAACRLAEEVTGLEEAVRMRLAAVLGKLGLPISPPDYPAEKLLEAMRGDKKTERGVIRFVLPEKIGSARVAAVSDEKAIMRALRADV